MNWQDKLRVLLPHWIEHNAEHAADFRTWAGRAGEAESEVEAAAVHMEAANESLASALAKLGGPIAGPDHDHHHHG
jgi:hypothetical protein